MSRQPIRSSGCSASGSMLDLGSSGCWFESSHSDLEHDGLKSPGKEYDFDVYFIYTKTAYRIRDGTS